MADPLSTALIGRYRAPRYRYGETVTDAIRGDVIVTRTSAAPIPWPMGKAPGTGRPGSVVFAGLEKALRTESASAVCHHWGVTAQTVSKWRRLLGIDQKTAGALRLRRALFTDHLKIARSHVDQQAPQRRQRVADAKRGKPRPAHVHEAMRRASGMKLWTAEEDQAVKSHSPSEAARITGRSMRAVYIRRQVLGLTDGRRRS